MGIMWSESRTPFVPAPKELPKEQSANQLLLTTHDTDDRYRKTHSSPVRTSRAAVICCHICNNFPPRFDWTHRGCTRTLALGTRTLIISAPTRIKLESAPALFSSRATCNWQASNPRSFVWLIFPKFWKLLPKSLWWWDSKSVRKQEGWMAASLSHTVSHSTDVCVGRQRWTKNWYWTVETNIFGFSKIWKQSRLEICKENDSNMLCCEDHCGMTFCIPSSYGREQRCWILFFDSLSMMPKFQM